jgi:hypothetical protein
VALSVFWVFLFWEDQGEGRVERVVVVPPVMKACARVRACAREVRSCFFLFPTAGSDQLLPLLLLSLSEGPTRMRRAHRGRKRMRTRTTLSTDGREIACAGGAFARVEGVWRQKSHRPFRDVREICCCCCSSSVFNRWRGRAGGGACVWLHSRGVLVLGRAGVLGF